VTRVAVIGCGAIGSLYAAHLARVPGVEVWAVDPWAEHVDAIGSGGLRVTGLADFTAEIRASTNGRDLPACDFGLVATKALHTRGRSRARGRPWPAPPWSACRTGSATRR
jgi:2-dehydropantoate 2-reductase